MPSFDVVNKVDMQKVDDAINIALKKIGQRYDFKGATIILELNKKEKTLKLEVPDEMKLKAVQEIVNQALIDRGVSAKIVDWGKREAASLGAIRLNCKLSEGIEKEHAKKVVEVVKATGLKVTARIQGDEVKVESKQIDDLQAVMAALRAAELPVPVQFENMKR